MLAITIRLTRQTWAVLEKEALEQEIVGDNGEPSVRLLIQRKMEKYAEVKGDSRRIQTVHRSLPGSPPTQYTASTQPKEMTEYEKIMALPTVQLRTHYVKGTELKRLNPRTKLYERVVAPETDFEGNLVIE